MDASNPLPPAEETHFALPKEAGTAPLRLTRLQTGGMVGSTLAGGVLGGGGGYLCSRSFPQASHVMGEAMQAMTMNVAGLDGIGHGGGKSAFTGFTALCGSGAGLLLASPRGVKAADIPSTLINNPTLSLQSWRDR